VKFNNETYVGAPINTVKIYNEMEVDELIFLDIKATIENRKPSFAQIKEIATECFMPFAYGGGIKTIEDMKKIFSLGAEKIVLNNVAVENPSLIKKASEIFGSQSIVVSIDAKKTNSGYETYTQRATKTTKKDPVSWAKEVEKLGAGEIFLTSIDKDGTFQGYDTELIEKVSKAVAIPVIVCGGAKNLEDFVKAKKCGASAVAAGSLFVYQGPNRSVLINYPSYEELREVLG